MSVSSIAKHSEWIRFALTLAAVASLHFFDGRYVAISLYQVDRKELGESMMKLQTALALLEQNRESFRDHELRLRTLESRKLTSLAPAYYPPNIVGFQRAAH